MLPRSLLPWSIQWNDLYNQTRRLSDVTCVISISPLNGNELHTLGGPLVVFNKCDSFCKNLFSYIYICVMFYSQSTGLNVFNKVRENTTKIYLETLGPDLGLAGHHHSSYKTCWRRARAQRWGCSLLLARSADWRLHLVQMRTFPVREWCFSGEKHENWVSIHLSGRGSPVFACFLVQYLKRPAKARQSEDPALLFQTAVLSSDIKKCEAIHNVLHILVYTVSLSFLHHDVM